MKNLTEGNIYKTFILFALPLILAGFLSQAYNIIDSIIAGKFLGETGLAAVGATAEFIRFINSFFWGFGTGVSVYSAILFGSGNYKALKMNLYSNTMLFIAVHIVISIVAVIFKDVLFDFLRVDAAIEKEASVYYIIYVLGMVFISLNYFGTYTMHALGMSAYPFRMSMVSTVLNIGGNLLSVAVFKIGVVGIALSSVLAAVVVDICYLAKINKCYRELGVEDYKATFSMKTVKKTFSVSIPTTIQQSVMYLASLVISPVINGLGSSATAAYSVVMRIYDINAGIYQNSGKTLMNYTAQCVGAGKYDSIKRGVRVGFLQSVVFLAPFLILSVIFARAFCSAFFPENFSGEALELAVVFTKYFLPIVFANVINNLFHSFFRGIKAADLLLISTGIGTVSRIAATLILAKYYGMYGVYAGWAASWILEAIYVLFVYYSGVWKRKLMI